MTGRAVAVALFALACLATPASADELRPGYLELKQTGDETYDVRWKVPALGDMRLGLYVRFPAETEVTSEPRGRFVGSAFVERWSVRHPGGLADQTRLGWPQGAAYRLLRQFGGRRVGHKTFKHFDEFRVRDGFHIHAVSTHD